MILKIAGKYNFWQRDSLNIALFTSAVFHRKLNYIHNNPKKANLCNLPEDYLFSSFMEGKLSSKSINCNK